MRSIACITLFMLTSSWLFSDEPKKIKAKQSPEKVVLKGAWGRLECTPLKGPVILPGNKLEVIGGVESSKRRMSELLPRDQVKWPNTYREMPICTFEVFDAKGAIVSPRDEDEFSYLVAGKPRQIVLKSTNPASVEVMTPGKCKFDQPGKAVVTVKFAGEGATFPIEVVRSKIHQGMSTDQAKLTYGKPTVRYRLKTANGTAEVWRWEKQPWLSVYFISFDGNPPEASGIFSKAFPTDAEIDEIKGEGRLIEDARKISNEK